MMEDALLARLERLVPAIQARAPALDEAAAYPAEDMADLAEAGLLQAVLPSSHGGAGLGTEPAGAPALLAALQLLGRANLAVGRLFEAHVNAARLVARYAPAALLDEFATDTRQGCVAALWVTDPPGATLRADKAVSGAKQFCSGAGFAARAVVTAEDAAGQTRLCYVRLDHNVVATPLPGSLAGMRAARTGQVRFDGADGTLFGAPGDYLREPDFSCGAWRTTAVTVGGLDSLVSQIRQQLRARGRTGDPHQQARFGQALIALEGARLWAAAAATRAEAADPAPNARPYVGLARLAVERACLDVIELAQRSLGVAALQRGNPVERIARDLATYLRQPAADMVLTEAAAAYLEHET